MLESTRSIQVQSMDSSHVALVSLNLKESAFNDFKCERPALEPNNTTEAVLRIVLLPIGGLSYCSTFGCFSKGLHTHPCTAKAEASLGMNVDSLTKILKMTSPNDSLKIRHQVDSDAACQ